MTSVFMVFMPGQGDLMAMDRERESGIHVCFSHENGDLIGFKKNLLGE